MNRLKLMRAYLVGPMDHKRNEGREWREIMTEWLSSRGVVVFDPYHKPMRSISSLGMEDDENYRIVKDALSRGDKKLAAQRMKPVRTTDLRIVDHSDFDIVYLDLESRPCGTWEELFTANRQKKPILIMCPQGLEEIPPWLYGTCPYQMMFDKWEDLTAYLDFVDTGHDEEIDTLGRWVFFDVEDQVRKILGCANENLCNS